MMFRRILEKLSADTRAAADRKIAPQAYAQGMARLGSMFVGELHGHHGIEDAHYFPVLAAKDAQNHPAQTIDVVKETADLWFHTMVMLSELDLSAQDVLDELAARFGVGGHEEKAGR